MPYFHAVVKGHLFKDLFNLIFAVVVERMVVKGHLFKDLFNEYIANE